MRTYYSSIHNLTNSLSGAVFSAYTLNSEQLVYEGTHWSGQQFCCLPSAHLPIIAALAHTPLGIAIQLHCSPIHTGYNTCMPALQIRFTFKNMEMLEHVVLNVSLIVTLTRLRLK